MTLTLLPLTPSERKVLDVLMAHRGQWVSGVDLNRVAFAYSQRIGALRRKGYAIQSTGRGGIASYKLG